MRARRREALAFGAAAVSVALVFLLWPTLDLAVARLFHDPVAGFRWAGAPPVVAMYRAGTWMKDGIVVAGVATLVASFAIPMALGAAGRRQRRAMQLRRRVLMLFACSVIGAGVVIDAGLKPYFARPRPREVAEFSGSRAFVPAFVASPAPGANSSFPSGHAAVAFSWIAWGALGAPRRRRRWGAIGIGAGLFSGLGRMAQGAHFLSDVLVSGLVIWGVCIGVRALVLAWRARPWPARLLKT